MNRRRRWAWLTLAYGCVGLGAVGAVLPVMPTTPFLLVALWAGARSSPRLRFRLFRHHRYGPALRAWHRHGAVPPRAKLAACTLMSASWLFLLWTGMHAAILVGTGLFFVAVAAFIVSRPSHPGTSRKVVSCRSTA